MILLTGAAGQRLSARNSLSTGSCVFRLNAALPLLLGFFPVLPIEAHQNDGAYNKHKYLDHH